MKKISKKKKLRKITFLFTIVFGILVIILLKHKNSLLEIEKIGKDSILKVQDIFVNPFQEKTEESIDSIRVVNEELEKEIKELKEMLNLSHVLSDKIVVRANIVGRNLGFFYETVTINKGTNDGIEEGMAVVTSEGLIGKTIHVSTFFSDVQLLTGQQMGKISVKIKSGETYVYGLLVGYDSKKNVYKIEGISETMDVVVGEEVTTTGYGDVFPSGILIGKVSNITTDHFDLTKIIEVTPASNVQDFSVVSVLKRNVNLQ